VERLSEPDSDDEGGDHGERKEHAPHGQSAARALSGHGA
jgi:hypothetical protein